MNTTALIAAPTAAFLLLIPLAAAGIATLVAVPALAEQAQTTPCSTIGTIDGTAATVALSAPGPERRASLRNPPTPIPAEVQALYQAAAAAYQVPWPLLAGVGMEETNHGRTNHTSTAGAQGLMQFMPATFAAYGVDGNHDGTTDITNDADSIHSAAHYLAASGATEGNLGVRRALFAYNHATWYVNDVLHYAAHYAGEACLPDAGPLPDGPDGPCPPSGSTAERGLQPNALRALRCVKATFPWITSMGGVGGRPNKSDHPAGRAVDFMIPNWNTPAGNANGWKVAHWLEQNAADLNVTYIIFDDHIWRSYRASQGWTPYTHPNGATRSPTLRHLDHVHLSTDP